MMNEHIGLSGLRVLLIDDHPMVRHGVGQLLQSEGAVVILEAENRRETLERLGEGRADLALLDLSLGGDSGHDILADLCVGGIPVLIYSMHEDPGNIAKAMRLGARGYVTKREKPGVLCEAVAAILAGRDFLSPVAARNLAENTGALAAATDLMPNMPPGVPSSLQASAPARPLQHLSERERDILRLLSRGLTRQEIAVTLGISSRTVETYYQRMTAKLDLADVKALRKYAITQPKIV